MISANEARQLVAKAAAYREELIECDKKKIIAGIVDGIKARASKGEHSIYVPATHQIWGEDDNIIYYHLTEQDFAPFVEAGYEIKYQYCMDALNAAEISW